MLLSSDSRLSSLYEIRNINVSHIQTEACKNDTICESGLNTQRSDRDWATETVADKHNFVRNSYIFDKVASFHRVDDFL